MPALKATPRTLKGRKNYHIRAEGRIPAVVYGIGEEPQMISVDRSAFVRLFRDAGESTLVDLEIEGGKTANVLIQDYQVDPLRDEVIHADFRAVDMTKTIEADVKLNFIGESPAVKGLGGTLVRVLETLSVEALPKDLVSHLDVDLSVLATFDDAIHVRDVKVPEGITVLDEADATIAIVAEPRSEEEMAALDGAVDLDVSKVEVAGEKKEEAEAGAEVGAGAAEGAKKPE